MAQGKQSADDACTPIESRAKCKEALVPFEYDAGKIVRITFRSMSQQKEYEIPLYMGEKYRLVFNREGLPQNVSIKVYDKKQGSSNRKVLYSSDDASFDEKQLIWEPESTGKIFIHFDIPATSDVEKKGCILFLLGYKG